MWQVLTGSWALFLGMFMLMIGNGLQSSLLGLRGESEGFSTFSISVIMSAYFLGFLVASRVVPDLIRRVGHVRVFAALGSTISAVVIMYPLLAEPWLWTLGRVATGFCFCGVYVTAESWLNNASSNENRGKALSLYMIMQLGGIVLSQYMLGIADINGYVLFVMASILVSLACTPILLSIRPTPAFDQAKPFSIKQLLSASPLASMSMFLLGGIYAAQFGMSAVYASRAGFSIAQTSTLIASIYVAALFLQYPIGWLSDRMDRRFLIFLLSALAALGCIGGFMVQDNYLLVLGAAVVLGGTSNPLYALSIAYANDYLEHDEMAAASGGLLFVNGVGAIAGPFVIGYLMDAIGPRGFWLFLAILMSILAVYALYRMTQRAVPTDASDNVSYAPISAAATPVAVDMAQEVYIEAELEENEDSTSSDT